MDNLSGDYTGFGREVELLMGALRERTPGAAIILLSPMLQVRVWVRVRVRVWVRVGVGLTTQGTRTQVEGRYVDGAAVHLVRVRVRVRVRARVRVRFGLGLGLEPLRLRFKVRV